MVILCPIAQFGCEDACSTVADASRSSGQSRNAPPEAVMVTCSTAAMSSPVRDWKMAECSLSTGRIVAPWRFASAISRGPAVTRLSLLASAKVATWASARNPGTRPAAPTIPDMTQSAGRSAASATAASPPAVRVPVPASAARRSGSKAPSAITASSARSARACSASRATLRPAVSATVR